MKREAATFCLGLWLMGTVCVSVAAMQDFYTIDRLLADPGNDSFAGMVDSCQGRSKIRPKGGGTLDHPAAGRSV